MENNRFRKKIFSVLLDKARGDRSLRQFAIDCDISYVQMRKLSMCTQENPPRPKLIKKIAEHSENGIELEDLMFAAGLTIAERQPRPHSDEEILDKLMTLPAKKKKIAEEFIDFLYLKRDIKE